MKDKNIISEVARMQSLFGYKRGVVVSEQAPLLYNPNYNAASSTYVRPPMNIQQFANQQQPQGFGQAVLQGAKNAVDNSRQQNINNMFCSVKNGVIVNPASAENGKKWEEYKTTYSVTAEEEKIAKGSCGKGNAAPASKPQPQFVQEKFPLKYMMQGENVKKLQTALDVRNKAGQPNITGKFYNATQSALDAKAQELGLNYDRNVGLTEEDFNQIVNPTQPRQIEKVEPVSTVKDITAVPPAAPTNLTAKPTQIQVNAPQPAAPQLSQQSQQALSGELTPQQIRQQSRFDQRLARQARRNERRAGRA